MKINRKQTKDLLERLAIPKTVEENTRSGDSFTLVFVKILFGFDTKIQIVRYK